MNFAEPFNKTEILNFLRDTLLPEDFKPESNLIDLSLADLNFRKIKEVEFAGESHSLNLKVYLVKHESENDPRITLSRETFRLMNRFGTERALAVFYSPNSPNYRLSLITIKISLEGTKAKKEYSNPRRYSFFLGPDAKTHTPEQYLVKKGRVLSFEDLKERFSIEVVATEFYRKIANWYFWALKKVYLPKDVEEQPNGKNIALIRLITRLMFVWFMKQKKLVNDELFDKAKLSGYLKDLSDNGGTYYKAILQNLFFALSLIHI